MAKKHTGLLIALGAALGAAAAGLSYYLKYKSFNDEIDKDFHDYEEDAAEEISMEPISFTETNRNYITLDGSKNKSVEADVTLEEAAPEETPIAEEATAEIAEEPALETPIAATVEEDTEGAN